MQDYFRNFAQRGSATVGSPWAFWAAVIIVVSWAVCGPLFKFSDTWQLVINTGTTVITFLVVFLIQNTQNRDARAIHLKLDELIRAMRGARTGLVELEKLADEDLDELQKEFHALHQHFEHREDAVSAEYKRRKSKISKNKDPHQRSRGRPIPP